MALWTHTNTWVTGETITASKMNAMAAESATNDRPSTIEDYSSTTTEMRTVTDPGESGSESLATSLAGELERLRYAIKDIKGTTYWYETPGLVLNTGGTITSTDAGATVAPTLELYRNSASPAVDDILGGLLFAGEDDASDKTAYASITGYINDPTDSAETGGLIFNILEDGTTKDAVVLTQNFLRLRGNEAGATENPTFRLDRNSASPAASDRLGNIEFTGRDDGANITVFGNIVGTISDPTDTTEAGGLAFQAMVAGTLTDQMFVDEEGIKDANGYLVEAALSSRSSVSMASAASAEITGIRSDTSLITIGFSSVSLGTGFTDNLELVIGDSGGYVTTGYIGGDLIRIEGGIVTAVTLPGDAFLLANSLIDSGIVSGSITLCRTMGELWVLSGILFDTTTGAIYTLGQRLTLSSDLDRIKVQTSAGNTWDTGTMAVFAQ